MKLYEKGNDHFLQADFDELYLWDIYYDAKRKNLHEKCVEVLRLLLRFDKNHVRARKLLEYGDQ
jgi:hypothetical protein